MSFNFGKRALLFMATVTSSLSSFPTPKREGAYGKGIFCTAPPPAGRRRTKLVLMICKHFQSPFVFAF